jgi:hypothetical protein
MNNTLHNMDYTKDNILYIAKDIANEMTNEQLIDYVVNDLVFLMQNDKQLFETNARLTTEK